MRPLATQTLTLGISLIALAWLPPMPVGGAQLSDAFCAVGVGLTFLGFWPQLSGGMRERSYQRMPRAWLALLVALAAYGVWATLSMIVTHGSAVRVLGVWWLIIFGLGIAVAAQDPAVELRIRRALIVAAVIGAATGLVGAILFFAGKPTNLLNTAGDLVPGHYPRIRGTMMRANGLAGLLGTGILLARDLEPRLRWLIRGALLLALVFTFSRTWIALAGTAAVIHFAFGPRPSPRTAVLAAIATVGVMLVVSWANVRLDPSHPTTITFASIPGTRLVHLREALHTIAAHPLFGVGVGRAAGADGWQAHFTLANVAGLMGIPAALALLTGFALAVRAAWRAARAGHATAITLVSVLVLHGFDALARDVEDQRWLWIVMGLVITHGSSQRRAESAQPDSPRESSAR
ncbi:MAG TPA: O-antigen ligase family protein [Kofleriaceae bacterium]|nr:O-antigen ligase family protein [Kofleriaceae bacterium]